MLVFVGLGVCFRDFLCCFFFVCGVVMFLVMVVRILCVWLCSFCEFMCFVVGNNVVVNVFYCIRIGFMFCMMKLVRCMLFFIME